MVPLSTYRWRQHTELSCLYFIPHGCFHCIHEHKYREHMHTRSMRTTFVCRIHECMRVLERYASETVCTNAEVGLFRCDTNYSRTLGALLLHCFVLCFWINSRHLPSVFGTHSHSTVLSETNRSSCLIDDSIR